MPTPGDPTPQQGLTTYQVHELEHALSTPAMMALDETDAYQAVSFEYGMRAARLLAANDLRGALNAAEISLAAETFGVRKAAALDRARERLEALKEQGVNVRTITSRRGQRLA